MNRSILVALTISVVLNLFLAGFGLGLFGRFPGQPPGPSANPHALLEELDLEPDLKSHLAALIDSRLTSEPDVNLAISEAEVKLLGILTASQFDASAFREQLRKLDELQQTRHSEMSDLAIEIAEKLNRRQRMQLADYLQRQAPPRR